MLTKIWYDICLWISEFLLNLCDSLGCKLKFNNCYSCLHVIPTNLIFSNVHSVNNLLISSYKRRRQGSCFIGEVLIPSCVKWVLILLILLAYRINIKYCRRYWVRIPSMQESTFKHSLIKRIQSNLNWYHYSCFFHLHILPCYYAIGETISTFIQTFACIHEYILKTIPSPSLANWNQTIFCKLRIVPWNATTFICGNL